MSPKAPTIGVAATRPAQRRSWRRLRWQQADTPPASPPGARFLRERPRGVPPASPSYSPAVSMRELITMDHDEVAAFLGSNARARVSSLNKDGSPHVVPISYVVLDGDLTFWADNDSQKVVNLRRDPRVAAIVDDGMDFQELRGVQVAGRAELSVEPELSDRVADLFAAMAPEEHREGAKAMLLA